ncbi:MAG TPA: 6-aminohexanoate hydrolase [Flavobacteriaceae bacterium]|nr:6-aminohexanoate hydrolase [Flavobacteriaceae bacterium]
MKKILVCLILVMTQMSYAQKVLTAEESDPKNFNWMKGFPPAKEDILSAIDGSFFNFPALRYSVCHMREFFPTVNVASAQENRYTWTSKLDKNIDKIAFTPLESKETMTWEASLQKNYTDGIIVLHKGTIVYEKYFGELNSQGRHALMSVSKTLTGTLGGMLVAEGILDENKKCSDYIPELKTSAFGDATIRQVLDMTTALQYSEDYSDPNAEVWAFSAAGNPFPKPANYNGPTNYYDYLKTVKKNGKHGEAFGYKTVNTDVMGWIITKVMNKPLAQILSEKFWQPLGTNFDGYYQIDGAGIAFAGGGFNANLRDLAMFGEMIRSNGYFNNKQILPKKLVDEIKKGGNQKAFAKADYKLLKNWSYKDMWWVTHNEHQAFMARGVHGQAIYVDPKAEMIIVRFASNPVASNSANDPYSLPAYHAVAKYLLNKKEN